MGLQFVQVRICKGARVWLSVSPRSVVVLDRATFTLGRVRLRLKDEMTGSHGRARRSRDGTIYLNLDHFTRY